MAYTIDAIHTNTIEGFWSLLKRAWYGSHHHYVEVILIYMLLRLPISLTIETIRISLCILSRGCYACNR